MGRPSYTEKGSDVPSQPVLQFLTITDPKQVKARRYRDAVKSHAMADHCRRRKQRNPQGNESRKTVRDDCKICNSKASNSRCRCTMLSKYQRSINHVSPDDYRPYGEYYWGTFFCHARRTALGSAIDPFKVLPQTSTDLVDVARLKHHAVNLFDTDYVKITHYFSGVKKPIEFLAGLCIAASNLDLMDGLHRDSKRTLSLKTEVLQLLRQELESEGPWLESTATMLTVIHLLYSDLLTSNSRSAFMHADGLARMLKSRGGPAIVDEIDGMGTFATSVVFHVCLASEKTPPQLFLDYIPLRGSFASRWSGSAIGRSALCVNTAETPILCRPCVKRGKHMGFLSQVIDETEQGESIEYLPIRQGEKCSDLTHSLLCEFREATNIFLGIGSEEPSDYPSPSSFIDRRKLLGTFLARIQDLPSAGEPDPSSPGHGDWLYECVRLVLLVYFTSLYHNISFSEANVLLRSRQEGAPYPSTAFASAVLRTDYSNCWADMSAFLMIFCLIMGAAASPFFNEVLAEDEVMERRARNFIVMTSIRAVCTLSFEPANAILGVYRIMVEVQRRLQPGYVQSPEAEIQDDYEGEDSAYGTPDTEASGSGGRKSNDLYQSYGNSN